MRRSFFIFLLFLTTLSARAADTLSIANGQSEYLTKRYFTQLEDRHGTLLLPEILISNKFHASSSSLPFIKYVDSAIWVKFVLKNNTSQAYIPITISTGIIDAFDLYSRGPGGRLQYLSSRKHGGGPMIAGQNARVLNCNIQPDSALTIYLRIQSNDSMAIPISVQSADEFEGNIATGNLIIGFFMGIVIVMIAYNFLLFILVRDINYFYYVLYIFFLGLTQWQVRGFSLPFLHLNKAMLNDYVVPLTRVCFWCSILLFVHEFLQIGKNLLPRYNRAYMLLFVISVLPVVAVLLGKTTKAYSLITISASVNSVMLLVIGITLYSQGFKPAKFFMLGWTMFLVTVLATIARNKGLIEYNSFTANIVLYSSAFELIIFSVALADRINFYRKQHIDSQALALTIARENEKLITTQNIALENRVKERTQELIESNKNLSVSIENFKSAQIQLIETEKMASLGQLTAGIAHEINNPINFVSANIKPLKMDMGEIFTLLDHYYQLEQNPADTTLQQQATDYRKQIDVTFIRDEIQTLLDGIEEGANRTVEIVQSLRAFSRSDEPVLKPADINRSILTTLVILRSTIPYYIEIKPLLDKLPPVNCFPGKINQVLVNLINNSIQAIEAKPVHHNESVLISTHDYPENIVIQITDTGIGMSEEVKQHIFDPFFTTKDVGEGTGLGLSIVFGIIEQHQGHIEVISSPGEGCTFKVMLPKTL